MNSISQLKIKVHISMFIVLIIEVVYALLSFTYALYLLIQNEEDKVTS